jgi:hypothetical protein
LQQTEAVPGDTETAYKDAAERFNTYSESINLQEGVVLGGRARLTAGVYTFNTHNLSKFHLTSSSMAAQATKDSIIQVHQGGKLK